MINQISKNRDAYPVHTYIDEYIFFNRQFKGGVEHILNVME